MIGPQILYVENHDDNEWVTLSFRRWWCPWFRVSRRFFSGTKWEHTLFSDERGKSFRAGWLRNMITIYEAEQKKVTKLLEAHDLPGRTIAWEGKLTSKTQSSVWFDPENEAGYGSWLVSPKSIPPAWIGHRVRITMEILT